MKILVTGSSGFVGSHIVQQLRDLGFDVVPLDVKVKQYNVCDYNYIRPLFMGVDCVLHLAAEVRIQDTLKDPILAAKTNVMGTATVLRLAQEHGVKRFVFSSTAAAYTDNPNPYSITKIAGEEYCKMYTNLFGLQTVILRYFNIYGEGQPTKGQYAPVMGIFLDQKRNNKPMTIVGDGSQRRDFIHVSDVAKANIACLDLENKDIVGKTFDIGTGTSHSILDIKNMIGGKHIHLPERKAEIKNSVADIENTLELLDWKPEIKLENWIKQVI